MTKSVLAPTDFSRPSRAVVDYALDLASTLGGEVSLLHVVEPLQFVGTMYGTLDGAPMMEQQLEAARAAMEDLVTELRDSGKTVSGAVVSGVAHDAILREADRRGVDMIVMGTHGRTGLGHLLIGSVAERVVRLSACPVLTVRETEESAAQG